MTRHMFVLRAKRVDTRRRFTGRVIATLNVCRSSRACSARVINYVLIYSTQGGDTNCVATRGIVTGLLRRSGKTVDA